MARIGGVDLPSNKPVWIALTYIYGIGIKVSMDILEKCQIEPTIRVKELAEDQIVKIRDEMRNYVTEGDLRRRVNLDIRRLREIGSYRGSRHRKNLPTRGQRTHTNARTKRGKAVAVAGKKKVTK